MAKVDELKKRLDEGLTIAREGVAYAAARAEDISRVTAIRLRIFGYRRRVERFYAELGEEVYKLAARKANVWTNAAVKKTVKEVDALEVKIAKEFARLDALSRRAGAAQPKRRKRGRPSAARGRQRRKTDK